MDYLRRRANSWRWWLSPGDWLDVFLDRAAVVGARVCIANSELGARGLREDYGASTVEVVYNGVDLERFRPDHAARASLRSEMGVVGPVAVFVGNDFVRKGLDVALAALPSDWALWVVGTGKPPPAPARVRFFGAQANPERFLQAADVLVLPTHYDPFANVCLEALACGVPVLTTRANGASEIVPEPWMIADDIPTLRAAFARINPSLGAACRAAAESFPQSRSFQRALELLVEASR